MSIPQRAVRGVRRRVEAATIRTRGRPLLNGLLEGTLRLGRVLRRPFPVKPTSDPTIRGIREIAVAVPPAVRGPRVLVTSLRWWHLHLAFDWTLAHALRRRGADVHFLRCGGGFPACEVGRRRLEGPRLCRICTEHSETVLAHGDLPVHTLLEPNAAGTSDQDVDGLLDWSLLWLLRRGAREHDAKEEELRADLRVGARAVQARVEQVLDEVRPDVVVLLNGLFFEEAVIRSEVERRGLRVVTYEGGQRPSSFFFAHGAALPAPRYDITELWESVRDVPLQPEEDEWVEHLLCKRRSGDAQPQRFFKRTEPLRKEGAGGLRLGLFTNVVWDSAVIGRHVAFPSMPDWVTAAIELAGANPEVELVIRAHPSETRGGLRQTARPIVDHIDRSFTALPENVTVVGPNDPVDSYALLDTLDGVLVYTSTVGLEAAAEGFPVAVAGETHYRGRGFTLDVKDPADLSRLFEDTTWVERSEEVRSSARKYIYALMGRSLMKFRHLDVTGEDRRPLLRIQSTSELDEGKDAVLDVVASGILEGKPFVLSDDLVS